MKTQKERFGIKPEGENMAQRLPVLYNKKPCYDIVFQQSFDGLWEELQELGKKSLQLFDEELRENNEEESYLIRLQGEVQNYKNNKRKITGVSLASSTNVDYYTADGYSFARISCGYTMTENGKKSSTVMVYLLRRDDNRRWKIYGWETADQLNSKQEQTDNN